MPLGLRQLRLEGPSFKAMKGHSPHREGTIIFAVAAISILVAVQFVAPVHAETQAGAMTSIQSAYSVVLKAERTGANVTSLDESLTIALNLVNRGTEIEGEQPALAQLYYSQAEAIASQVAAEAANLAGSGTSPSGTDELDLMLELGALGIAAAGIYFLLPRLFWRMWTWSNKDAKVGSP